MGKMCAEAETGDEESNYEQEEEEEALSLCDLPVNLTPEESDRSIIEQSQAAKTEDDNDNFDFGSFPGGSLSTEPAEMCAADEVFFKGQILPLRLSFSSDSGLSGFHQTPSRCISRSDSMDRVSLTKGPFTSSSRSSSCRSHYSSSSATSSTNTTTNSDSKPRIRNQFMNSHYPSPKPQIRISRIARNKGINSGISARNQKSSMWDFLRLGLVRAPEIELQDLKVRTNNNSTANRNASTSVSRNSSCSSSNSSSCTAKNTSKINISTKNQQELKTEEQRKQRKQSNFLDMRRGLLSGCKCSFSETVPLNNIVVIKSSITNNGSRKGNESSTTTASIHAMEEKLQKLKIKKNMKEKQQGKQALSRHRTFEWLEELSHASYVDEA